MEHNIINANPIISLPDQAELTAWAQSLGFDAVAVTDVDLSAHAPHVREWLARGFAGDMGYLRRNLEKRLHPEQLELETCRVISARMNYLPADTQPLEVLARSEQAYISRYALGRDYHKVIKKRLVSIAKVLQAEHTNHEFRPCVDTTMTS